MKGYEHAFRPFFPSRLPVIVRVDGKAFHTYTAKCVKPFDNKLIDVMDQTAIALCKSISGAKMAYIQSDEISILVHGYEGLDTQPWFGGNINKIVSVTAAVASATFTALSPTIFEDGTIRPAIFDSRAFIVPEADVCNYFLWRQQDATRNSIQSLARSMYSHKECDNKNTSQLQELTSQKGVNWFDIETRYKRGRCVVKEKTQSVLPVAFDAGLDKGALIARRYWTVDNEIPIFSQDRNYINAFFDPTEPQQG